MIKTVINPKYQQLEDFVKNLPQTFSDTGEVLYADRNTIKVFDVDGFKVNVKYFRKPLFINQIIYGTFRKSKAERSYLYANMLEERGFHTPNPIAYMEKKQFGLFKESFYLSIHEDFDGLMREFRTGSLEGREELLKRFALYTADLHEKQVLHLDYSSGNILYKLKDGKYTFYLVDLNRMEFDKPVDQKAGCYSFRRLWGSDEMFGYIVCEYAKARNFDEKECIEEAFKYRKEFWNTFNIKHPDSKPYFPDSAEPK